MISKAEQKSICSLSDPQGLQHAGDTPESGLPKIDAKTSGTYNALAACWKYKSCPSASCAAWQAMLDGCMESAWAPAVSSGDSALRKLLADWDKLSSVRL